MGVAVGVGCCMTFNDKLDKILNDVEWRDGSRKITQVEAKQQIKDLTLSDVIGDSGHAGFGNDIRSQLEKIEWEAKEELRQAQREIVRGDD